MSRMEWWQKLRRAWLLVTARLFKASKNEENGKCKNIAGRLEASSSNSTDTQRGLLQLRDDVATCDYQDVHVLWNIVLKQGKTEVEEDLEDAESDSSPDAKEQPPKKQSWRAFLCPRCSSAQLLCFAQ